MAENDEKKPTTNEGQVENMIILDKKRLSDISNDIYEVARKHQTSVIELMQAAFMTGSRMYHVLLQRKESDSLGEFKNDLFKSLNKALANSLKKATETEPTNNG